jgi:hypothetical protein
MEGSGKGASFYAGALLGGSILGIQKDMGRRAQEMDMFHLLRTLRNS